MKTIVFALLLAMVGAVGAADLPGAAERFHDDEYGVTCWMIRGSSGNSISCIPDGLLEHDCGAAEEEQHEPIPASSPEIRAQKSPGNRAF